MIKRKATEMPDSAEEIFRKIMVGGPHRGLTNDLLFHLHKGFRVDVIRDLIKSDNPHASSAGVFLLEEMREAAASLRDVALELNNSPDAWRRRVFVRFAASIAEVDDDVLKKVYERLGDLDLSVRCAVIEWVVLASVKDTLSLCKLALFDFGGGLNDAITKLSTLDPERRRDIRALYIGLLMKNGVKSDIIFDKVKFEDSFTVCYFSTKFGKRKLKFSP
ncbi:hypothetical protein HB777_09720 [Mesorhizobium loti]|nr:hypothetical protein HB777_09720 [Mesorhizobium loti]